ncbi:flagellar basal-body MS-ring/collar protein FliF [Roseovarius salinarum]|uniref:flagellar basal-body MS-ring/collar protein FliF n=1 Tax=Roseovarius salinarum TaxID=1981892 RepID=UPI000C31BE5B|nr:flagellar basal-body MS-ring/collar protein FliF [Roseovarius salinarum]
MQQITTVWRTLDMRRRGIVIAATVAAFVAVLLLARMAASPSMNLLYSGLQGGAAGEVVAALEKRGVAYEIRGNSIFVDAARRDKLRMTLAGEGLPRNSTKGYELLDGLSGFGTTSQMFDAAYWRAKEGELARTILSTPSVESARVHIATTGSNPFQRDVEPSASVAITTAPGGISHAQARALKYLVASAVAGLAPVDVSVIDGVGGLVGTGQDVPANSGTDRSDAIRERVLRLLEARVGRGNAVVEVSLDVVKQAETIRERRIDPDSRVAISTDTEERTNSASDQGGGQVTVASNLPDGDAEAGETSTTEGSETRERVNYEVSEVEREVTRQPGALKRLTVAVLVNGTTRVTDAGDEVFEPRTEEELAALRELVASAVGYDESRGDVITLKTMAFEPAEPAGTAAEPSLVQRAGVDVMSLVQTAVLALVALLLGVFVLRPLLSRPAQDVSRLAPPGSVTRQGSDTAETGEFNTPEALTGEVESGEFPETPMQVIAGPDDDATPAGQGTPAEVASGADDAVARLRELIGERQEETVEILRTWLEGGEEGAR